jgi:hypothetical protein
LDHRAAARAGRQVEGARRDLAGSAAAKAMTVRQLLSHTAGSRATSSPTPAPTTTRSIYAAKYLGVYANSVGRSTVTQDSDGRIWMTNEPLGELAELIGEVERTELVHLEGDTLIPLEPKYAIHIPQVFTGDDGSGRSLRISASFRYHSRRDMPAYL